MDEQLNKVNSKLESLNFSSAIKALIAKFKGVATWSFPAKILLTALIGGLGGSSFVGFLSEYATYVYCVSYGIRPPAEGIPYLKASVTAASIFLLTSGSTIFIAVLLAIKYIMGNLTVIESIFSRLKSDKDDTLLDKIRNELASPSRQAIRNLNWKQFLFILVPVFILLGWFLAFSILTKTDVITDPTFFQRHSAHTISILLSSFFLIPAIVIWRPASLWWVAAIASITNVFFWITLLFTPKYHAELLQAIGYGGGLPITIELKEKSSAPINGQVNLLLRTGSSIIILEPKSSLITEISIDQIAKIQHGTGGLYRMETKLP
ncbi:hypothetical protein ACKI1H_00880 [Pseudomonas sp. YH-1]|uniref:hypothetical protein n=1 Tax=Pseudomonas sp. YH-1 TaxID=3384787 RepID=UPI003F802707